MPVSAAIGRSFAFQARDAGAQASKIALDGLKGAEPAFAFIFASNEYGAYQVLSGVVAQLPNIPALTLSTSGEFTDTLVAKRSVAVALLSQGGIQAHAELISDFPNNDRLAFKESLLALDLGSSQRSGLFLSFDDANGEAEALCRNLPRGEYRLAGWLTGSDVEDGASKRASADRNISGLAAALLTGDISIGVGVAHGWQPVGAYFEVTVAEGPWVRSLDGRPASERYAQLFGHRPSDWSAPPLNALVRLYPLGIEHERQPSLQVRTPKRVEADGSLLMAAPVRQGSIAHLLVGTVSHCRDAAREAARQAIRDLGDARPVLAVVVADASWQLLFESQPGGELEAIRGELGVHVPIVGGYNFGQITHLPGIEEPEFLNQHIQVVLLGEKH